MKIWVQTEEELKFFGRLNISAFTLRTVVKQNLKPLSESNHLVDELASTHKNSKTNNQILQYTPVITLKHVTSSRPISAA